ncbi:scavenger receptor class B member 1-like [Hyposmocoma kahamanoa]|uniref:scavenger receptor class B member 1-like n=1 Tax=Hyposmocoma kahamanoa TaxID=1477025 RepID=UPI000E6D8110|nr:scavenger receptor class B member 1-like [Hyposmocoma kahamanoa]
MFFLIKCYTSFKYGFYMNWFMHDKIETIQISVTLFNITNADRFISGKDYKLKMEEVGPFTYQETRLNEDVEIDLEKERMYYTPQYVLDFLPEKSIGNPKDFNIVLPNIVMAGLTSKLTAFPFLTKIAYNMLTTRFKFKPLLNIDAHSFIWGYNETLLSAIHDIIPGYITYDKVGLLHTFLDNDTRVRVEVSIKDEEKFMVKSWNGYSKLKMGEIDPESCEKCNTLEDTYDGIGYPPGRTKDFRIKLIRKGLCRTVDMEYNSTKTMYYGGEAMVYQFRKNYFGIDPNKTYDGLHDMSDCYHGLPVTVSYPHFLDVDPKVYERIEGMTPNENVRGHITIEPQVALEVETKSMLQVNLALSDVSYNPQMRPFANMTLPTSYVHIVQNPLPKGTEFCLIVMYKVIPYVTPVTEILLFVLMIYYWLSFCIALYRRCRPPTITVSILPHLDTKVGIPLLK